MEWQTAPNADHRGEMLRQRRQDLGLSPSQIASKVTGWSAQDVLHLEGQKSLHPSDFIRYTRALTVLAEESK